MLASPDRFIQIRNAAKPLTATEASIITALSTSEPVKKFSTAELSQEDRVANKTIVQKRAEAIQNMPEEEQRILFESVAGNPPQLRELRQAVRVLSPEKQSDFYENVVAKSSRAAYDNQARQLATDKADAQKTNNADELSKIQNEEAAITKQRAEKEKPATQPEGAPPEKPPEEKLTESPPPAPQEQGGPLVIRNFSAIPESITSGSQSMLTWSVDGAKTLFVLGEGITDTNMTGRDTLLVSPKNTATYTLRAVDSNGNTAEKPVTVTVRTAQV